jgi:hypothetical protein
MAERTMYILSHVAVILKLLLDALVYVTLYLKLLKTLIGYILHGSMLFLAIFLVSHCDAYDMLSFL